MSYSPNIPKHKLVSKKLRSKSAPPVGFLRSQLSYPWNYRKIELENKETRGIEKHLVNYRKTFPYIVNRNSISPPSNKESKLIIKCPNKSIFDENALKSNFVNTMVHCQSSPLTRYQRTVFKPTLHLTQSFPGTATYIDEKISFLKKKILLFLNFFSRKI